MLFVREQSSFMGQSNGLNEGDMSKENFSLAKWDAYFYLKLVCNLLSPYYDYFVLGKVGGLEFRDISFMHKANTYPELEANQSHVHVHKCTTNSVCNMRPRT